VEPIQGEGGYVVPEDDFLPRLRELCDRHGILLIADEVQSGAGRTGKMRAIEHWGVEPDILLTAKGIGSGMPVGAMVARSEIMSWGPGAHGSTYGGNPVSLAALLETISRRQRPIGSTPRAATRSPVQRLSARRLQPARGRAGRESRPRRGRLSQASRSACATRWPLPAHDPRRAPRNAGSMIGRPALRLASRRRSPWPPLSGTQISRPATTPCASSATARLTAQRRRDSAVPGSAAVFGEVAWP
jgi:hypothetical protein